MRRPHCIDRPEPAPTATPEDALLELSDRVLDLLREPDDRPRGRRLTALVAVTVALRPLSREERFRVVLDALALLVDSPLDLEDGLG